MDPNFSPLCRICESRCNFKHMMWECEALPAIEIELDTWEESLHHPEAPEQQRSLIALALDAAKTQEVLAYA